MYLGTSAEPLRRETTRLLRAGVDQGRFRVDLNIARSSTPSSVRSTSASY